MLLSPHFSLTEMTKSAAALRLGIDNSPTPFVVENLRRLAVKVLEPVRARFGVPFSPSSGYRGPALNRAIGGVARSQHLTGEAVDFEVPGVPNLEVARWVRDNLGFDQLLLEYWSPVDAGAGWVHCSLTPGGNRKEVLTVGGGVTRKGLPA
ncbi:D-Ala-D-Ala carboxypeptidase family metallohydrolase [Govanella unica]|uniref:D-Ala-D-Ala carboxypeptidase family metallohydrolase n=1 Tax=Govanella unica TaxID=2975056 RepID=A0A9X3TY22_9PROT|nr:D-Ala-D-Ala carboxypeptidase family metallohydrolase [Govania unica]MDA5194106.1 D-Ala-D-Ala carboxypeptidase family metallohydrolase [Govania unica]